MSTSPRSSSLPMEGANPGHNAAPYIFNANPDTNGDEYDVLLENSSTDGYRPRVLVYYTGGTIGMIPDPESGALKPAKNAQLRKYLGENMPELSSEHIPSFVIEDMKDGPIDSSNMSETEWRNIALTIAENYYDYDGFVVIMGTDTMAYASSAVSFMLENLGKPVVFTGSMIPLFHYNSDARRNLLMSLYVAGHLDIPEVLIFFGHKLLRANRSTKLDSWGLEAFASMNMPPLGELGIDLRLRRDLLCPPPTRKFRVSPFMSRDVAVIHLVPGFSNSIIKQILESDVRGIVLLTYGSGNIGMHNESDRGVADWIHDAAIRGVVIMACSQCKRGSVNTDTYVAASALKPAISSLDMTVEATVTKLSSLLSRKHLSPERVRALMKKPLRGEMTIPTSRDMTEVQLIRLHVNRALQKVENAKL